MYMLSTCLHDRELGLEGGGGEVCIQEEELEGALSLSLSSVSVDQYTFLQKCIDRYLSIWSGEIKPKKQWRQIKINTTWTNFIVGCLNLLSKMPTSICSSLNWRFLKEKYFLFEVLAWGINFYVRIYLYQSDHLSAPLVQINRVCY